MSNPFKQLAQTIQSRKPSSVAPDQMRNLLDEVLDEHLDMVAAAHHSNHGSAHHSHPTAELVG